MKVQETSHEKIRAIARAYVRRDYPLTLTEIAFRLNTSRDTISKLLHRGIAEGILDRPTAELVYHKNVYANKKGVNKRIHPLDKSFEIRNQLISSKFKGRKKLQERISDLKNKMSSYDSFAFEEDGAPSLQDLENELINTIEELAEVDDFLKFVL